MRRLLELALAVTVAIMAGSFGELFLLLAFVTAAGAAEYSAEVGSAPAGFCTNCQLEAATGVIA
jgi:hypothetical protein